MKTRVGSIQVYTVNQVACNSEAKVSVLNTSQYKYAHPHSQKDVLLC